MSKKSTCDEQKPYKNIAHKSQKKKFIKAKIRRSGYQDKSSRLVFVNPLKVM